MQGVLGLNMQARDVINKYLEQYKEQLILRIKAQPPDAPFNLNPKAVQDVLIGTQSGHLDLDNLRVIDGKPPTDEEQSQ